MLRVFGSGPCRCRSAGAAADKIREGTTFRADAHHRQRAAAPAAGPAAAGGRPPPQGFRPSGAAGGGQPPAAPNSGSASQYGSGPIRSAR